MYIARREIQVMEGKAQEFRGLAESLHAGLKDLPGFRWAMLLQAADSESKTAVIEMWLTEEQAAARGESDALGAIGGGEDVARPIGEMHGYDVTTARGSMTPASFAAIVEWEVDEPDGKMFTERWNAAYHHIEDRISSRLLRDLNEPAKLVGFHVAQSADVLTLEVLGAELRGGETFSARPIAVERYDVVLLTEG